MSKAVSDALVERVQAVIHLAVTSGMGVKELRSAMRSVLEIVHADGVREGAALARDAALGKIELGPEELARLGWVESAIVDDCGVEEIEDASGIHLVADPNDAAGDDQIECAPATRRKSG